jgi:molybdate/tungstate transport system substrate-binding protein
VKRDGRVRYGLAAVLAAAGLGCVRTPTSDSISGPLTVFNAGSLAAPFRELLQVFAQVHPGIQPRQESSGSLEAARKLTELGRVPDVLGVADSVVIPALLVPRHATWYATFASNAMVLLYTPRSAGADEINGDNWWRILLRPGVRTGRSDPALDPNGYRTLMVYQLAERYYGEPGLAARLLRASPPRWMRAKEADLVALVQSGDLDYAWSYRSIAATVGLPAVSLPPAIDLSDPAHTESYRTAAVRLPGATQAAGDSVTLRGDAIVYAVTIPTGASNPVAAAAFVRFLFSPDGQAILERHGFLRIHQPTIGGPGQPPPGTVPDSTFLSASRP